MLPPSERENIEARLDALASPGPAWARQPSLASAVPRPEGRSFASGLFMTICKKVSRTSGNALVPARLTWPDKLPDG